MKLSLKVLGLWSMVLGLLFACERIKENATVPTPQPPPSAGGELATTPLSTPPASMATPSINVANVVLQPKNVTPTTLSVEVAATPEEKAKGLMGRENLPDKHGMWFVFEDDVQEPFWMKDTPISLDIIFVDKDYRVVDIIANTTPNSELLLVPRQKYRYVLELKATSAANYKLGVGDKVEFRLGPP